jgi:iron(III) transport system substrate-binding protein
MRCDAPTDQPGAARIAGRQVDDSKSVYRVDAGAGGTTLRLAAVLCSTLIIGSSFAGAAMSGEIPAGYPASYASILAAARSEGRLSIYATTDAREVVGLLKDFRSLHPGIDVEYADLNSTELYSRFIAEDAAGEGSADLLWSAAMDLQVKLVHDGYAQPHDSPERSALPEWAVWKNQAYGVTAEPIVFVYNKRRVPPEDVPASHADLERLLRTRANVYRDKVAAYNPERSGTGFLYMTQDLRASQHTWALVRAMGGTRLRLYTSTGAMMERIASGEHLIAYNVIGSYAFERQSLDPSIAVVVPHDYTLVMSRVALIPAQARHPNAAKVFLDYLLSQRGQQQLAAKHMPSVRTDQPSGRDGASDRRIRAIPVGPELLANLDQIERLKFLKSWRAALDSSRKGDANE